MTAIIIVGYKSKKYLPDCLESIFSQTYRDFKVYFIDNNSNDGSIEFLNQEYPEINIIRNKKNIGFAAANNIAASVAIDEGADNIFLLNPDTVLAKDCLELLSKRFSKNSILQPLILIHNGKKTDEINTSGGLIHYLGYSYCSDYGEKSISSSQSKLPLASGAAMIVPANIIKNIGLFDQDFFMYHEDVDFSWRARLAGYQIVSVPEAKVWHKYSFSQNPKKFFYFERNRGKFILKNYSGKTIILLSLFIIISELLSLLFLIITLKPGIKLLAWWDNLANLGTTLKKRKIVQQKRRISDKELFALATCDLDFAELRSPIFKIASLGSKIYWLLVGWAI